MTTITVGKRLIPIEQVALVEPFDPAANPKIQTDKPFRSRVVLLDRESVLAEFEAQEFAKEHGFRWLMGDQTAVSPTVRFGVEKFAPVPDFTPKKPYLSRLVWHDLDGNTQSKLLLAEPEALLAIAVRGEPEKNGNEEPSESPAPSSRRRKTRPRQRTPAPV